jgi:hypothetical protein
MAIKKNQRHFLVVLYGKDLFVFIEAKRIAVNSFNHNFIQKIKIP